VKKLTLVVLICCLFSQVLLAQNRTMDSVKVELRNAKEDTNKVKTLINLIEQKAVQYKKDIFVQAESKKQKLIILFVVIGLLFAIAFAGFIFRSLRIRNKQNEIIKTQKSEIESSFKNLELLETKADKQPIGMSEDNHPFTNHEFKLSEGDSIYLFSDGFADQFSPDDEKLMRKRFKEVLLSIQHLSLEEQRNYLDNFIEKWKVNMEQTDDILVMGFKV
jgi:hypothetical protein